MVDMKQRKNLTKKKEYTVYYKMTYLSINFPVRLANVVLSRSKLNISRHTSINNFIRILLTQKSNDLISRSLSGHTS